MPEMSMEEISVVSVQGRELYAYIGVLSLGKSWPNKIVHLALQYELDSTYDLPAQMGQYIQAARYFLVQPE